MDTAIQSCLADAQATILSHDRMWIARVVRQRQTSNKLRIMLAEAIRQIKENQVKSSNFYI